MLHSYVSTLKGPFIYWSVFATIKFVLMFVFGHELVSDEYWWGAQLFIILHVLM